MTLTPQQLEKRRYGLGGSDISAICGLNPWKKPIDVYLEKTTFSNEEVQENEAMWFGTYMEPVIIKRFLKVFPQQISYPDTFFHKDYPFLLGNVDGILEDGSVLEIKNVGYYSSKKWGETGSDIYPTYYYLQAMHYNILTDAPKAVLAALICGSELRTYEIARNKEIEDKLIQKCVSFWNDHVIPKIPPPIEDYESARKFWTDALEGSKTEVTDEVKLYINRYKHLKKSIDEIDEETDKIRTILANFMKDNELLIDEEGTLFATFKKQKSSSFNTESFKKDHKDLYEKYLVKKETQRILKVK